jgi:kynurenine formamidase
MAMCLDATLEHRHGSPPGGVEDAPPVDDVDPRIIDRRRLLRSGAAAMGATAAAVLAPGRPAGATPLGGRNARTVDLTHRLVRSFPDFFGAEPVIDDEVLFTVEADGFYAKRWSYPEHIGTHLDAPGHFTSGGRTVDDLTTDELVAPLAVVDIRAKVTGDPNAMVEPADLVAYEHRHGRIPDGAFVAMLSGWADLVGDADAYRGGVGFPDLAFPGFSIDAAEWLIAHRDVVGIGVDTMSLDPGSSTDFAVHVGFLGSDRYGVENLADLASAPPRGATVVVGAVPCEEGSGGPCRVLAIG